MSRNKIITLLVGWDEYPNGALMKANEVAAVLGVSQSTIWAWAKAGKFPAPFKIDDRATRWRAAVVREWLAAKEAGGAA